MKRHKNTFCFNVLFKDKRNRNVDDSDHLNYSLAKQFSISVTATPDKNDTLQFLFPFIPDVTSIYKLNL